MFIDLHIHTYFSDGTQSPESVVDIAKSRGLSVISICDHNNVMAYERLFRACRSAELNLIPGVEVDVHWKNEKLHLLAYNFDFSNKEMCDFLDKNMRECDLQQAMQVENMEKDFPQITISDYRQYTQPLGRGGTKILNYLYDKGLSKNVMDSEKYKKRYSTYQPKLSSLESACKIICGANGIPVLAHPGVYWHEKINEMPTILENLKLQVS